MPANTASPKCWLSGEPSSLKPLQPCLPGGGQRLLVVGKEGEYTHQMCSHLWWRVSFVVIFGVWPGPVRRRLCGAVSLQPASPWLVLVSALCPFAVLGATCWYVDPWPGVGWVCVMSLPLSSPSSTPCISWGSISSPPRLCWGRFWHDQRCLVRSRAKL